MTIKKLTYIGLALCTAVLAGCKDEVAVSDTLSGDGNKTPLTVTAVLDAGGNVAKTRAADKEFASGDQMVAYLRHVTWNGGFTTDDADKRTSVEADQAPKLVTFSCTGSTTWDKSIADIYPFKADSTIAIDGSNSQQATGLSTTPKLYWDDFSNSASAATDLRTAGHYLQSYYGYCYNGGDANITTALTEETGVLGWKIIADQSGAENFKKSDLLWSAEQKPVKYGHADKNENGDHGDLIIPYTHAMSKVTVKVTLGTGFDSNYDFVGTAITLNDMRLKCTANAPVAKLSYPKPETDNEAKGEVKMKQGTGTNVSTFEAIVVPSILTVGNTFATITNMAGNKYTIPVTNKMVQEAKNGENGWGSQLGSASEDVSGGTAQVKPQTRAYDSTIPAGTGFQMKSGVHYVLNVTVNKTEVNVTATILDWDEIEAEGVAEIHFDNDIKDKTGNIDALLQEYGFDIYQSSDRTNFGTRATHLRYNKTSKTWKYDPVIYWQGGSPEYFRALANVRADAAGTTNTNESLIMENGRDALWGTTEAHRGKDADGQDYDYDEGAAIKPRTGDVPLKFYHAMSQITFNLVDALAGNSDGASHLDLHGATIQLTDLATGGTLDLNTGIISPSIITAGQKTFSEDAGAIPSRMGFFASMENGVTTTYKEEVTLRNYIITPQTIGNDATVIVTLADGTVYKAQLNKCTTEVTAGGHTTDEYITEWKRGNHYTYTIELGKETITFRAMVENWTPVEGGGKATLEWD